MNQGEAGQFIHKAMALLAGMDPGQGVQFPFPGTDHIAMIRLEKGYAPERRVCLTTGAVARGDDHLVRHFLHETASMEEMKAWLSDPGNADKIEKSLRELSERVSEGFD